MQGICRKTSQAEGHKRKGPEAGVACRVRGTASVVRAWQQCRGDGRRRADLREVARRGVASGSPPGLVGRVTLKPVLSEPGSRKAAGRFRLRPLERLWQGWD